MFKHILVPSDGSLASEAAIRSALQFAKETGARVTGMHVLPDFHALTYLPETLDGAPDVPDSTSRASQIVGRIAEAAARMGVPCETVLRRSDQPYAAIVSVAGELKCDMIAMASHGHRGIKGLLLGSETHKVLTHTNIPVLVFRA
ncbi:universal stress protein [Massilia sp. erpn]|uniref:universal stress protein n=1 Tax=Massilia sp. erpn TaxID=2738142 RepID=UPI002104C8A0|nr:universal stress protein [Massilia sp. erpn]UTY59590.1 universal stress protein [Massilia sp. erpn]